MFKILELKSKSSAPPTQVGDEFDTREDALAAVKRHLKTFKVSGKAAIGGSEIPRGCASAGLPDLDWLIDDRRPLVPAAFKECGYV